MSDAELVSFFLSDDFGVLLVIIRQVGEVIVSPGAVEGIEGVYETLEEGQVFLGEEQLVQLLQ